MGFLHQLHLLLWKNISLKRRGPVRRDFLFFRQDGKWLRGGQSGSRRLDCGRAAVQPSSPSPLLQCSQPMFGLSLPAPAAPANGAVGRRRRHRSGLSEDRGDGGAHGAAPSGASALRILSNRLLSVYEQQLCDPSLCLSASGLNGPVRCPCVVMTSYLFCAQAAENA